MRPEPRRVVEDFITAINRQDLDALTSLMADDHVFVDAEGSVHEGRDVMAAGWRDYFDMFPDYQISPEHILADGGLVAVFGSTTGTYRAGGGTPEANRVGGPAAWRAVVEDGKIKTWQVYADYTHVWEVIGARENA